MHCQTGTEPFLVSKGGNRMALTGFLPTRMPRLVLGRAWYCHNPVLNEWQAAEHSEAGSGSKHRSLSQAYQPSLIFLHTERSMPGKVL